MKILYIGSILSTELTEQITLQSKNKPSTAPINFQRNLLKGFTGQKVHIDVLSVPPVAMYPGSRYLFWKSRKETFTDNGGGKYLAFVNLPVLKQMSMFLSTLQNTFIWCWRNRKDSCKCVLVYGQNTYVSLAQVAVCGLFRVKTCNIVTDPIGYVSGFDQMSWRKKMLLKVQWSIMDTIKKRYSAFVLLTKAMVEEYITEGTPYILLEGISDTSIFDGICAEKKAQPPVIMYAGALTEGFGIHKLLDAYGQMKQNAQLWLFGAGDCELRIQQESAKKPGIRFFGKVPWRELLTHMQEASVLVSVKPTDQYHTRYQFPSKIMEYMASGTPVASTMVEGIPDEYFQYIYPIEEDTMEGIAETLDRILSADEDTRKNQAMAARAFVSEKKNCYIQAERIQKLLEELI